MIIPVKTQNGGYDIYLERGGIKSANKYFNLERNVLIVTDSGVPSEYAQTVANQCKNATITVFDKGEKSKKF